MTDALTPPDRDDSDSELWRAALALLGEREGSVLTLRHGAFGGERLSFGEIGRQLGISRQRTHQIYEVALERLVGNEDLRALVAQLAAPRVHRAKAEVAGGATVVASVAEAESASATSAPMAEVPASSAAAPSTAPRKSSTAPRAVKRAAPKARSASEAPQIERRAGSVVVRPVRRERSTAVPARLEKVIVQLEGLQRFHAGIDARVRELLAYIEREMPR